MLLRYLKSYIYNSVAELRADELFRKAQLWLHTHDGQQELDFDDRKGKEFEEKSVFLAISTTC